MAGYIEKETLYNVRLLFRNFAGREARYNAEGNRNVSVVLDDETAERMLKAGWNVKFLPARDETDTDTPYIKVKVSYKYSAPRVVLITSRGRNPLTEELVFAADHADIRTADVTLAPSKWSQDGKEGVTAYLQSAYLTLNEDPLDIKYQDLPEITAGNLELESGEEWLEGEVIEEGPAAIEAGGPPF